MVFDLGTMFRGEDPEGKLSKLSFCGITKMFTNSQVHYNTVHYYTVLHGMINYHPCYYN